jgi:hypothetical protein
MPIVEKNVSRIAIPVAASKNGTRTNPIRVIGPAIPIGRVTATMYEKTIVWSDAFAASVKSQKQVKKHIF